MLYTAYLHEGLTAVRYPRGAGIGAIENKTMQKLEIGKGLIKRTGQKVAILNFGTLLEPAMQAAQSIDATVADMRFAKPLDEALITQLAASHELLVTIEENTIMGGAGSAVNEFVNQAKINCKLLNLGLPDNYLDHGDQKSLLASCGLDANGIIASINNHSGTSIVDVQKIVTATSTA